MRHKMHGLWGGESCAVQAIDSLHRPEHRRRYKQRQSVPKVYKYNLHSLIRQIGLQNKYYSSTNVYKSSSNNYSNE